MACTSEGTSGHDGDNTVDRDGDLSDVDDIEVDGSDASMQYHPISTFPARKGLPGG